MSDERHAVLDAPFGSPEAGVVKVYRMVDGEKVLVREEDPFDSDISAGTTLLDLRTKRSTQDDRLAVE